MALAMIGQGKRSVPAKISAAYRKAILDWEKNCTYSIQRNVGYVPGLITHNWHGKKKDRKYVERWDVLTRNGFDPVADLTKDSYGLYRLNMCHGEKSIRLRDEIRMYMKNRHEDSIDLE